MRSYSGSSFLAQGPSSASVGQVAVCSQDLGKLCKMFKVVILSFVICFVVFLVNAETKELNLPHYMPTRNTGHADIWCVFEVCVSF